MWGWESRVVLVGKEDGRRTYRRRWHQVSWIVCCTFYNISWAHVFSYICVIHLTLNISWFRSCEYFLLLLNSKRMAVPTILQLPSVINRWWYFFYLTQRLIIKVFTHFNKYVLFVYINAVITEEQTELSAQMQRKDVVVMKNGQYEDRELTPIALTESWNFSKIRCVNVASNSIGESGCRYICNTDFVKPWCKIKHGCVVT